MSPGRSWHRGRVGTKASWLLVLLVASAAAWTVAGLLSAALSWQLASALAGAVLPIVFGALGERFQREDDHSRICRANVRIYGRRGFPTVDSVRDLTKLNVTLSRGPGDTPQRMGPYVPRDLDAQLDRLLDREPFVLIVGDSKAGKSRMAYEAVRRRFPRRRIIVPYSAESLVAMLDVDIEPDDCVVWLDPLEEFLGQAALRRLLDRLTGPDAPAGATVVGTIRESAYGGVLPRGGYDSPEWPVLGQAALLRLDRLFSAGERERAAEYYDDPHLLAALGRYGLAEYLAAGPDLLARLDNGLNERQDHLTGQQVGAVVVLAVVDWSRTGLPRPIPPPVLAALAESYSVARGLPAPGPDQLDQGLAWASETVYATSSLLSRVPGGYRAFDYVIDQVAGRPLAEIPDQTWSAALATVHDGEEALSIGFAAHRSNRVDIAVLAFEIAVRESTAVNLALAAYNYALALERTDRLREAEEQYLRAAEGGRTEAAHAAGRLLQARGENAEARRLYRIAADAGHLESMCALGLLLQEQAPDEALRLLTAAADLGHAQAAYAAGQMLPPRGRTEALRLYRIAADAGHIEGCYALGMLLREQDPREALLWLTTAADNGHAQAAYAAGLFLRSRGNTAAAQRFFQIAAENSASGEIQVFTPSALAAPTPAPRSRLRLPGGGDALRRSEALAARTTALEQTMAARSDAQLRRHSAIFRRRLGAGETLEALAPEAFATLREAARRVAGLACGDEEIIAAAAMHQGLVAQLRPRPGRVTAIALTAYLRAVAGLPVHVIAVDEAQARADADQVGAVLRFLGLDAGLLVSGMLQAPRRLAYGCEVVFGTLDEFAFDYLRDHRAWAPEERVRREPSLAILTQAELQLLASTDEIFNMPMPVEQASHWYTAFAAMAERMVLGHDYEVDARAARVDVTAEGITLVEDRLGIDNLYTVVNIPLISHLDLALKAKELYRRGADYAVRAQAPAQAPTLLVLDKSTGRIKENFSFNDGLQQAIEAKERLPLSPRSALQLRIGKRAYLSRYPAIAGLADAVGFSDDTLKTVYGVGVVRIPSRSPSARIDRDDWFLLTDEARSSAVAELVRDRHETGQPVLVDAASTEQAHRIAAALTALGVPHTEVTAQTPERTAQILAAAGQPGAVTVSTNAHLLSMPDIPLGIPLAAAGPSAPQDAAAAGGLLVLGAQRRIDRWRDDRLRELTGRDGAPGETRFMLTVDDPLYRGGWAPTFAGDGPLTGQMLTWGIEARQRLIGATELDLLKRALAYDEVDEAQNRAFLNLREQVLTGTDISSLTTKYLHDALEHLVTQHVPRPGRGRPDWPALDAAFTRLFGIRPDQPAITAARHETAGASRRPADPQAVLAALQVAADRAWAARAQSLGEGVWFELQRRVLLSVLDRTWRDHLAALIDLRESVGLALLHNADPLVEYERQATSLLDETNATLKSEAVGYLMNLHVEIE